MTDDTDFTVRARERKFVQATLPSRHPILQSSCRYFCIAVDALLQYRDWIARANRAAVEYASQLTLAAVAPVPLPCRKLTLLPESQHPPAAQPGR